MSVSRRLRFEVLRRDDHTCRYCGGRAPDVSLTVDHVVPVTLGGLDEPSNLVAACTQCNAGKAAVAPDQDTIEDVAADALRWAAALEQAASETRHDAEERRRELEWFYDEWSAWEVNGRAVPLRQGGRDDWSAGIERFISAGLSIDELIDCVRVAMNNALVDAANKWRYFCGCAWKRVRALEARALEIVREQDEQPRYGEMLHVMTGLSDVLDHVKEAWETDAT